MIYNSKLIESDPDYVAKMSIANILNFADKNGIKLSEMQIDLVESICSFIPKSDAESDDICFAIDMVSLLMKKDHRKMV